MCTLSRNVSLISEISAAGQGEVTVLVAIVMSHPAKNRVFCLPCEKHFTHQKSLSEGGITLKHLTSLLLSPPWALWLQGWEHSRLSSGTGMLEQAQVPKCPANWGLWNNYFSLGPLQEFRSSKFQASHLCSYFRWAFFPRRSKGKEGKHGNRARLFLCWCLFELLQKKQFSDTN